MTPRRVNPAPLALGDHCWSLGHQREGRDGQPTTQALEGVRRPDQRRLQREALGGISPAVLVDVQTPARLLNRLGRRGLMAHHEPGCLTASRPPQGERHATIRLLGQVTMRPAKRLPGRHRPTIDGALTGPLALAPNTPVETHAPVPPQRRTMGHPRRVCDATLRRTDDGTPASKPRRPLLPHRFIHVIGHAPARMGQHCPPDRDGPARDTSAGRTSPEVFHHIDGSRAQDHPWFSPAARACGTRGPERACPSIRGWSSQRAHRRTRLGAYTARLCPEGAQAVRWIVPAWSRPPLSQASVWRCRRSSPCCCGRKTATRVSSRRGLRSLLPLLGKR